MSTLTVPPPFPLVIDMLLEMVEQGRLSPATEVRFRTKDGHVISVDANSMSISAGGWIELHEYDLKGMTEAIAAGSHSTSQP